MLSAVTHPRFYFNSEVFLIELYGYGTPNVLKINIALEEMGLRYALHKVDIWQGEQFSDSFIVLNPNSKVPVLVDQEGPSGRPHVVFESGAILLYLADKTGIFLVGSQETRSVIMQWLMFQMASFGPMCGQFNHFKSFAPEGNEYSLSRYTTEMKRLYGVLEHRLVGSAYLGGSEYSIADMATFPWIFNQSRRYADLRWTTVETGQYPAIARWFGEIKSRPAVKRAIKLFDGIGSTFKLATSDDLDRIFGRGRYAMG